jgi:hypothetical protein
VPSAYSVIASTSELPRQRKKSRAELSKAARNPASSLCDERKERDKQDDRSKLQGEGATKSHNDVLRNRTTRQREEERRLEERERVIEWSRNDDEKSTSSASRNDRNDVCR